MILIFKSWKLKDLKIVKLWITDQWQNIVFVMRAFSVTFRDVEIAWIIVDD